MFNLHLLYNRSSSSTFHINWTEVTLRLAGSRTSPSEAGLEEAVVWGSHPRSADGRRGASSLWVNSKTWIHVLQIYGRGQQPAAWGARPSPWRIFFWPANPRICHQIATSINCHPWHTENGAVFFVFERLLTPAWWEKRVISGGWDGSEDCLSLRKEEKASVFLLHLARLILSFLLLPVLLASPHACTMHLNKAAPWLTSIPGFCANVKAELGLRTQSFCSIPQ